MLGGQQLGRHNTLDPNSSVHHSAERDVSLDKDFGDFVTQEPSRGATSMELTRNHCDLGAGGTAFVDGTSILQRRAFRRSGAAYPSSLGQPLSTCERVAAGRMSAPEESKRELPHFNLPRLELEPPTPPTSRHQSKVIQVLLDPSHSDTQPASNFTGEGPQESPLRLERDEDPFPYVRFLSTQPLGVTAREALRRACSIELECHAVTTNETVYLCSNGVRTFQTGSENDWNVQQNMPAAAPTSTQASEGETSDQSDLISTVSYTRTADTGTLRDSEEHQFSNIKSKGLFTALRLKNKAPSTLREHINPASIGERNKSLALHPHKEKTKRVIPSVTDIFKTKTVREGVVSPPDNPEQASKKLAVVPQTLSKLSPKSTVLTASSTPAKLEFKTDTVDSVPKQLKSFKSYGDPKLPKTSVAPTLHTHNSPQTNAFSFSNSTISRVAQNTKAQLPRGNKPLPPLPAATANVDLSASSSSELCSNSSSYNTPAFPTASDTSSRLLHTPRLSTLPLLQSENDHLLHSPCPVKTPSLPIPLACVEQKYSQKPSFPGLTMQIESTHQDRSNEAKPVSGKHIQSLYKHAAPTATIYSAQASVKTRTGVRNPVCGTETGFPAAWAFNGATLGRMHSRPTVDAELLAGEVPPHAQRFAHPSVLKAQPPIDAYDAELHHQMALDREDPFHGLAVQRYRHRCVTQHKGLCTSITCACGCHMCQLWRSGESEIKLNKTTGPYET